MMQESNKATDSIELYNAFGLLAGATYYIG
jgi:hypothetical protein